jgi:hypothetical protein
MPNNEDKKIRETVKMITVPANIDQKPPEGDAFRYYWIYHPSTTILPGRLRTWVTVETQKHPLFSPYTGIDNKQIV